MWLICVNAWRASKDCSRVSPGEGTPAGRRRHETSSTTVDRLAIHRLNLARTGPLRACLPIGPWMHGPRPTGSGHRVVSQHPDNTGIRPDAAHFAGVAVPARAVSSKCAREALAFGPCAGIRTGLNSTSQRAGIRHRRRPGPLSIDAGPAAASSSRDERHPASCEPESRARDVPPRPWHASRWHDVYIRRPPSGAADPAGSAAPSF